jgi:hypothetical protein
VNVVQKSSEDAVKFPTRFLAMKRFRLSTLLLLVVIAALCLTVAVQQRRLAEYERIIDSNNFTIDEMTNRIRRYNGQIAEMEYALRAATLANGTGKVGR